MDDAVPSPAAHLMKRPSPERDARRRLGLRFVARLGAYLVLLLAPWPGLGTLYRTLIGAGLNLFGGLTFPVTFSFGAAPPIAPAHGSPQWALLVHVQDAISGRVIDTTLDLRRTSYLASAVFCALVLATPLSGRLRLRLLLRGLPLLSALVALPLLAFFSGPLPVVAFPVGHHLSALLQSLYHVLIAPPGMAYALPALFWLLLCWRHEPSLFAPAGQAAKGDKRDNQSHWSIGSAQP